METSLPLEQYRLLVEHAPTMVWRSRLDALCDYFNDTWLTFTGRTLEQELGNGWTESVHPEDLSRCLELYLSYFERREPFELEYRLRRHDGVYRYIFDQAIPFTDETGRFAGFIGSCIDVHERHEVERFRATAFALAAHELRTPLSSLRMFTEVLRRQLGQENVTASKMLARMNVQLDRISTLVQDLEDTGRLDARMPLLMRKEELDLAEVVRAVVANHRDTDTLRFQRPQRHTFVLSIAPGIYSVLADRQRLEQVMNNLLTNAVKYSPRGGTIRVSVRRQGNGFALSVSDSGIGIPAADLPSLTRRYFRASNASAQRIPGLGLGLSLVKDILEAHNGQLLIQSEQGQGTTVTVFLPEALAVAHAEPRA